MEDPRKQRAYFLCFFFFFESRGAQPFGPKLQKCRPHCYSSEEKEEKRHFEPRYEEKTHQPQKSCRMLRVRFERICTFRAPRCTCPHNLFYFKNCSDFMSDIKSEQLPKNLKSEQHLIILRSRVCNAPKRTQVNVQSKCQLQTDLHDTPHRKIRRPHQE